MGNVKSFKMNDLFERFFGIAAARGRIYLRKILVIGVFGPDSASMIQ